MKRLYKYIAVLLIVTLVLASSMPKASAASFGKKITILFTHDLHDHLLPFNAIVDGKVQSVGGYANLQSAINEEKEKDPDSLLLDAGDYSMGTLFQTIYSSDAPELRIMGQMGYDVVTLGNHEFDFRAGGLAESLIAAKKSGNSLPQIVASNISFPSDKNGRMTESLSNLKSAMDSFGVKDYTLIERNGVRVGIFGLLGKDADDSAPMAEVKFEEIVESAKRVVNILKNQEKVDLVIALSHSGTWADNSNSEDEILAREVKDIDVIISGHTHTKLTQPIIVGKTIIGSAGEYGQYLGVINISRGPDGGWKLDNYCLKPINKSLPEDPGIKATVEGFKKIVQQKYLDNFNLEFDQVLAKTTFNFPSINETERQHAESTLGNLIADSYIYAVKKAEGDNYKPITAALVPNGTIRASFVSGDITVSDAFNVSSLGIGKDKVSGYPLISVYLTGKELKALCEVDASVAPMMPSAQLYISGLSYTFNPNRLIFNKVTAAYLQDESGNLTEIDDNKLYRVVGGLYSAQMLSLVGEKSFNILSIVPKKSDGTPITDFESEIIYQNAGGKNYEVKEWLAVAEFLQSFEKENGVPQIPEYYSKTHDRKIVDNDGSIYAVLKNPNNIATAAYIIIIIIAALIIFIIYRIVTGRKRRQRRIAKGNVKLIK